MSKLFNHSLRSLALFTFTVLSFFADPVAAMQPKKKDAVAKTPASTPVKPTPPPVKTEAPKPAPTQPVVVKAPTPTPTKPAQPPVKTGAPKPAPTQPAVVKAPTPVPTKPAQPPVKTGTPKPAPTQPVVVKAPTPAPTTPEKPTPPPAKVEPAKPLVPETVVKAPTATPTTPAKPTPPPAKVKPAKPVVPETLVKAPTATPTTPAKPTPPPAKVEPAKPVVPETVVKAPTATPTTSEKPTPPPVKTEPPKPAPTKPEIKASTPAPAKPVQPPVKTEAPKPVKQKSVGVTPSKKEKEDTATKVLVKTEAENTPVPPPPPLPPLELKKEGGWKRAPRPTIGKTVDTSSQAAKDSTLEELGTLKTKKFLASLPQVPERDKLLQQIKEGLPLRNAADRPVVEKLPTLQEKIRQDVEGQRRALKSVILRGEKPKQEKYTEDQEEILARRTSILEEDDEATSSINLEDLSEDGMSHKTQEDESSKKKAEELLQKQKAAEARRTAIQNRKKEEELLAQKQERLNAQEKSKKTWERMKAKRIEAKDENPGSILAQIQKVKLKKGAKVEKKGPEGKAAILKKIEEGVVLKKTDEQSDRSAPKLERQKRGGGSFLETLLEKIEGEGKSRQKSAFDRADKKEKEHEEKMKLTSSTPTDGSEWDEK